MDQILDIPVNSEQRKFEYAGFWIRAAAIIIDFIIVMIFLTIVSFALGDLFSEAPVYPIIIVYGSIILYFTILESSEKQATLGKMAVGIKVGDKNGNRISFGRAVGRLFSKIISGMIFYIGYMMAGWDDRKQALHDKIADTFVRSKVIHRRNNFKIPGVSDQSP